MDILTGETERWRKKEIAGLQIHITGSPAIVDLKSQMQPLEV